MNLRKIIDKELFFIIILIFIILLFIKNINFFKNLYFLPNMNFDKRLTKKVYNYCSDDSIGYIHDITKKFNIKNNPKVVNFDIQPDPSWVFLNTSKPKSDKYIILLNYIKNPKTFFYKEGRFYVGNKILNASGIKEIQFLSKDQKPIKINGKLQIYKLEVGTFNFKNFDELDEENFKLKKIYHQNLTNNNYIDNKYLLDKEILDFGGRGVLNLIKIFDERNNEINNIEKIKVNLINKISLNDYEILDNFKNKCFYLKKNGWNN